MLKLLGGLAAAAALLGAGSATATTVYDAAADFSSSSATGVWSYGYSVDGGAFQAFTSNNACFAGLSCWQEPALELYQTPVIAKNLTGGTNLYANTVVHPLGVLNLHPGQTKDGSNKDIDTILRFTAPSAGTYAFSGFLQALDINPSGVKITVNGSPVAISGAANWGAQTAGAATPFSGSAWLAQGQALDVVVNRDGAIWNDSTGLSMQIAAVPEPGTWAVMIGGLGLTGFALRRRRGLAVA